MNAVNLTLLPQVVAFVEKVRLRLSDLDPEVRDELTDGLEADLSELVVEHGGSQPLGEISLEELLGTPEAYADELRAAAGLAHPESRRRKVNLNFIAVVSGGLDAISLACKRVAEALPASTGGIVTSLQPVWWGLRAWVAWMVAQEIRSPWTISLTPVWLLLLGAFVAISVQLGRGAWGFSKVRASLLGRTLLIGLNLFALCMVPAQISRAEWAIAASLAYQFNPHEDGLRRDGDRICNITAYDAAGEQLRGVQLFDQDGQPIETHCGDQALWERDGAIVPNVYPHAVYGDEFESSPAWPVPLAQRVPAVTSPVPEPTDARVEE